MRLVALYSRSRAVGYALAGLTSVALLGWAVGYWILAMPFMEPETYLAPLLLLASLLAACVIGLSASSPFGESEQTSGFPISILRFGHLGGLLVCAILVLTIATIGWDSDYAGWALVRNLLGFTGLSLLAARFMGSYLSWVAPFAFYILVVFTGRATTPAQETSSIFERIIGEVPVGEWERWAWSMRAPTDLLSWSFALALLILGLALVCAVGTREPPEERG